MIIIDPSSAVAFDRKTNIGLHRLALAVADQAALATVYERVCNHPGVILEFAPEPVPRGLDHTSLHLLLAWRHPDRVRDAPELTRATDGKRGFRYATAQAVSSSSAGRARHARAPGPLARAADRRC